LDERLCNGVGTGAVMAGTKWGSSVMIVATNFGIILMFFEGVDISEEHTDRKVHSHHYQ
jgi:hypothetical protein